MLIDDRARRLMRAVRDSARTDLKVTGLSPRALGELYLRIRERLKKHRDTGSLQDLVDDLSLTVYLAWLAEEDSAGPDLLVALKSAVAKALEEQAEEE
jgi:hypothetical protein